MYRSQNVWMQHRLSPVPPAHVQFHLFPHLSMLSSHCCSFVVRYSPAMPVMMVPPSQFSLIPAAVPPPQVVNAYFATFRMMLLMLSGENSSALVICAINKSETRAAADCNAFLMRSPLLPCQKLHIIDCSRVIPVT